MSRIPKLYLRLFWSTQRIFQISTYSFPLAIVNFLKNFYDYKIIFLFKFQYNDEVNQNFPIVIAPKRREKCIWDNAHIYLIAVNQNRHNLDDCVTKRLKEIESSFDDWDKISGKAIKFLEDQRTTQLKVCEILGKSDDKKFRCLQRVSILLMNKYSIY